jgi:hypothetical protein
LLDGTTTVKDTESLTAKVLAHGLIRGMSSTTGTQKPSYIPSREFAIALLDVLAANPATDSKDYWQQIRSGVQKIQDEQVKQALTSLIDHSHEDVVMLRTHLEGWFNDSMDRVNGWYKRKVRKIVLVLGLILTVILNADTLGIAQTLWNSPTLRSAVVSAAQDYSGHQGTQSTFAGEVQEVASNLNTLQAAYPPLGWTVVPSSGRDWVRAIVGLLLTTLAVSLGAPFWFDVLNKFMDFRAAGKPPASQPGQ